MAKLFVAEFVSDDDGKYDLSELVRLVWLGLELCWSLPAGSEDAIVSDVGEDGEKVPALFIGLDGQDGLLQVFARGDKVSADYAFGAQCDEVTFDIMGADVCKRLTQWYLDRCVEFGNNTGALSGTCGPGSWAVDAIDDMWEQLAGRFTGVNLRRSAAGVIETNGCAVLVDPTEALVEIYDDSFGDPGCIAMSDPGYVESVISAMRLILYKSYCGYGPIMAYGPIVAGVHCASTS